MNFLLHSVRIHIWHLQFLPCWLPCANTGHAPILVGAPRYPCPPCEQALRSEEIINEYDESIKDQLQKGIIEQVNINSPSSTGKTHYLPHHPVITRDKNTTKLRLVYDASAKVNRNPFLNECKYKGLCLLPKIGDVLIRSQSHKVALVQIYRKSSSWYLWPLGIEKLFVPLA